MYNVKDSMITSTATFALKRYTARFNMDPFIFGRYDVSVHIDDHSLHLVGEIKYELLENIVESKTARAVAHAEVQIPQSLWDYVKFYTLPRWVLNRWPVNMATIEQTVEKEVTLIATAVLKNCNMDSNTVEIRLEQRDNELLRIF